MVSSIWAKKKEELAGVLGKLKSNCSQMIEKASNAVNKGSPSKMRVTPVPLSHPNLAKFNQGYLR